MGRGNYLAYGGDCGYQWYVDNNVWNWDDDPENIRAMLMAAINPSAPAINGWTERAMYSRRTGCSMWASPITNGVRPFSSRPATMDLSGTSSGGIIPAIGRRLRECCAIWSARKMCAYEPPHGLRKALRSTMKRREHEPWKN